jgi:uncharacterized membrane protein
MQKGFTTFFQKPYLYWGIIVIGIALKFYGLESKFYWLDEVYTVTHVSGFEWDEFVETIPQDSVVSLSEFKNVLNLNNGDYTLDTQLKGLTKVVQLTPLHYFHLAFWQRIVGGDFIHYRLFSIFMLLLCIPLAYLVVNELTRSKLNGLIAMSLLSVSPFFHYYAQEARYYTLWAFAGLLLSWVLLKALKKENLKWWIFYFIVAVYAMYVSALSGIVLLGQFIYVVVCHRKQWLPYLFTGIGVFFAYLPWCFIMLNDSSNIMQSTSWQSLSLKNWQVLVGPWMGMSNIFFTNPSNSGTWASFLNWENHSHTGIIIQAVIAVLIIILIGLFVKSYSKKKTVWFLLLNALTMVIIFYGFDLFTGRSLSIVYRYQILVFIFVLLIIAVYLGNRIQAKKPLFALIFLGLLVSGLYSSYSISKKPDYHDNGGYIWHSSNAKAIDKESKPLIICESVLGGVVGFYETIIACTSESADVLFRPDHNKLGEYLKTKNYSNIYLLDTHSGLKYALIKYYNTQNSDSKLPLPIFLDEYSRNVYNDPQVDINNFKLNPDIDLNTSTIKFKLNTSELPATDTVFIIGSHYAIGTLNTRGKPLQKISEGEWEGTFEIEKGEDILWFTFTQGDWSKRLIDSLGNELPAFMYPIKGDTTITITANNWLDSEKL